MIVVNVDVVVVNVVWARVNQMHVVKAVIWFTMLFLLLLYICIYI